MAQTVAIFGGTFDPVHCGHLIVARCAAEAANLPRILLQPAATPPHKPGPQARPEDRLEMLRLAVAREDRLDVSDIELSSPGPSYTIDAVERLAGLHPGCDLVWMIGADMLEDLPNWHRAQELVERIDFLIAARPGWEDEMRTSRQKLAEVFGRDRAERICSGIVETPRIEISSTDIRRRRRRGLSVGYLVPEAVEEYIREKGLYRGD